MGIIVFEKSISPEQEEEERVLQERARILARPLAEDIGGDILHLLTFPLGNERYGVDITLVQEVKPLEKQVWRPVPCTPDFIVGVVNIRSRIYSVMDVARYMGQPPRSLSERAHIVLVRGGNTGDKEEMELCILADDRPESALIPFVKVQAPAAVISGQNQEYVRGIADGMLVILDLEHFLSNPGIIVHEEV